MALTLDTPNGLVPLERFWRARGLSRYAVYTAARSGSVAGVPVIKVGGRLFVSAAQAERILRGDLQPATARRDSAA